MVEINVKVYVIIYIYRFVKRDIFLIISVKIINF